MTKMGKWNLRKTLPQGQSQLKEYVLVSLTQLKSKEPKLILHTRGRAPVGGLGGGVAPKCLAKPALPAHLQ